MSAHASQRVVLPATLLSPDAALPQRDFLLDVDEIRAPLSSILGKGQIEHCVRRKTKYQVGRSLRVLYEVLVGDASDLIYARAYDPALSRSGSENCYVSKGSLSATFCVFPHDRKIKHLSLLDGSTSLPALKQNLGWKSSRIVAYAPEKSATAQCLDAKDQVIGYAKVYADDCEASRVFYIYRGLLLPIKKRPTGLQIAEPLALSESQNLLLLRAAEGERISTLAGRKRIEAIRQLGRTLAALHNLQISFALPPFQRFTPDRLTKAAETIGRARPDVATLANDLARRLCSDFPTPEMLVCLHSDVHPKNGVAHKEHVTLIDLDQASIGDSAADLGSMLAAIRYDRITGAITSDDAAEISDTFLSGYRKSGFLPQQKTLNWHIGAACLAERALRAITCVRCDGLLHLRELLLDAKSLVSTTKSC
jgi:tRNA A-37 threonylcarbamoyl transferase component Bud32